MHSLTRLRKPRAHVALHPARRRPAPFSGPATLTGTGNPVDSHTCRGHFVKLLALSRPREFSSALSVPAQPARIFAVCLATTSKKVCGSSALTAMPGSGVGRPCRTSPGSRHFGTRCRCCCDSPSDPSSADRPGRPRRPATGRGDRNALGGRVENVSNSAAPRLGGEPVQIQMPRQHSHDDPGTVIGGRILLGAPGPRSAVPAITLVSAFAQPLRTRQHRAGDRRRRLARLESR